MTDQADSTEVPRAVVLLSGGLDSSTVLAWARSRGRECFALSFDYGQRHRVELERAKEISGFLGAAEHRIVAVDLRGFGGSALTDDIDVPKGRIDPHGSREGGAGGRHSDHLRPGPHTIFLSFALAYAEVRNASEIWLGINAIDYSGYPDCRPEYLEAFQNLADLATKVGVEGGPCSGPARRAFQGRHRAEGPRARRTHRANTELLRPGGGRHAVRAMRQLHHAAGGDRRGMTDSRIGIACILQLKVERRQLDGSCLTLETRTWIPRPAPRRPWTMPPLPEASSSAACTSRSLSSSSSAVGRCWPRPRFPASRFSSDLECHRPCATSPRSRGGGCSSWSPS